MRRSHDEGGNQHALRAESSMHSERAPLALACICGSGLPSICTIGVMAFASFDENAAWLGALPLHISFTAAAAREQSSAAATSLMFDTADESTLTSFGIPPSLAIAAWFTLERWASCVRARICGEGKSGEGKGGVVSW